MAVKELFMRLARAALIFPKYDQVHYNAEGVLNIGKALAEKVCE